MERVEGWKASDGTIHETREGAGVAELTRLLRVALSESGVDEGLHLMEIAARAMMKRRAKVLLILHHIDEQDARATK